MSLDSPFAFPCWTLELSSRRFFNRNADQTFFSVIFTCRYKIDRISGQNSAYLYLHVKLYWDRSQEDYRTFNKMTQKNVWSTFLLKWTQAKGGWKSWQLKLFWITLIHICKWIRVTVIRGGFFLFFTLGRSCSLRTNIEEVDSNYFLLKENCRISVFCYFFILFCLFFSIWP